MGGKGNTGVKGRGRLLRLELKTPKRTYLCTHDLALTTKGGSSTKSLSAIKRPSEGGFEVSSGGWIVSRGLPIKNKFEKSLPFASRERSQRRLSLGGNFQPELRRGRADH